jgi:hypothetical protein
LESVWLADTWGTEYGGTGRGSHQHIEQLLDDFAFEAAGHTWTATAGLHHPACSREAELL